MEVYGRPILSTDFVVETYRITRVLTEMYFPAVSHLHGGIVSVTAISFSPVCQCSTWSSFPGAMLNGTVKAKLTDYCFRTNKLCVWLVHKDNCQLLWKSRNARATSDWLDVCHVLKYVSWEIIRASQKSHRLRHSLSLRSVRHVDHNIPPESQKNLCWIFIEIDWNNQLLVGLVGRINWNKD